MSTTVSDTSKASSSSENISTDSFRIEERDKLPRNHVGSVIGKGGEMIRDLQTRSGCFIVVDNQDGKSRLPPMITYRGKCIEDINFAKSLVSMLCNNQKDKVELALGQASMKQMQVHKSDAGRIIGRGGKMINKLQVDSQARIQIDHSGKKVDCDSRLVIITGTEDAVVKAEKMVEKLLNDPIAYSKSKSSGRGRRSSSSITATTTSSTSNSIPKHIDTAQEPQPQHSVASEVLAKRIVELESDLYCARSALMVQQPYQQQYPQPYCSQPCYPQDQQPYYYDPHYGWVATASAVDGEVHPYNPAA